MTLSEHGSHTEIENRVPWQGVVWDYDGLLVDTEKIWFQSCQLLCAEFGIDFTEEHNQELKGGKLSQKLKDRFSLPHSFEEIRAKLNAGFHQLSAEGITMMPGALELLQNLNTKFPMAIATNSNTHMAVTGLKKLGIEQYFKAVIGGDQVEHSKPAPDSYLQAAKSILVTPSGCLALDDQPLGIEAASSAGMFCIGVSNRITGNEGFPRAHMVLESLELMTPEFIQELQEHPFFTDRNLTQF